MAMMTRLAIVGLAAAAALVIAAERVGARARQPADRARQGRAARSTRSPSRPRRTA